MAKVASKRFVEEGAPLNDTIRKLASSNDLGSHHIERVCEMANLQTHAALIPSEPEKRASFSFPLADAKEVVASLHPAMQPQRKILSDYTCPPCGLAGGGPTMSEMFGASGDGHRGFESTPRQQIVVVLQKKAALRQRGHDLLLKTAMEAETAELEVHKHVKQAVMHGMTLDQVHEAASAAGLGDVTAEVLQKTAQLLKMQFLVSDEEVEKTASYEAPEELIDRSLPVTVINGRNAMIASLDTLRKYNSKAYHVRNGLVQIDDEVRVLRQKLKDLE
ncbi:MAG: hypothetical protein ACYTBJ_05305 [Planctomycetota bacterium]